MFVIHVNGRSQKNASHFVQYVYSVATTIFYHDKIDIVALQIHS